MTFPCSYGFAAFWTAACMLGGFAIACICRSDGRAEDCVNCDTWRSRWLKARRHLREANRGAERNAMALQLAASRLRDFAGRAVKEPGMKADPKDSGPASITLRQAAQRLRLFLEGPRCVIQHFDIPDCIYGPFVRALDRSSPPITPPGCGLPEEAVSAPQRAGTYSPERILTHWPASTISTCCMVPIEGRIVDGKAVLHCPRCYATISPAPSPGTGPDAGTGSANSALERGKGGGDNL